MQETKLGWKVLDREGGVLHREYKFGGGVATTLVFRGEGNNLIVISPGNGVDGAALDELKEFGQVTALVANNSFHWLGQPAWRKHFPEAKSYAPVAAIPRLTRKSALSYEPLAELAPLLGDGASVSEPTGMASNAFAFVRTKGGTYWYSSDLLSNIPALPPGFVIKTVMSMTDSAPGYKLFRPAVWLQVRDKRGLTAWFDEKLAGMPPTIMVPAHGGPVQMPDLVAATRALVARM